MEMNQILEEEEEKNGQTKSLLLRQFFGCRVLCVRCGITLRNNTETAPPWREHHVVSLSRTWSGESTPTFAHPVKKERKRKTRRFSTDVLKEWKE